MANAGPALVFEAAEQGSVVMAALTGVINEDNALDERLTATRGKGVLIDLANIERINSCGVRDWIRFAQRLEAAGNALYLLRCSPVVVAQLNMVRNFCGEKGQVLSFQAPYFCPSCDEERTETFPATNVGAGTSPDATCPVCKSQMEFDDLPDLYFAFAKIHGSKAVPPEIQSAVENFRTSGGKQASTAAPSSPPPPRLALAPAAAPARPATNPNLQVRPPTPAAVQLPARPASNPGLQARPPTPAALQPPMRPASNPSLQARPGVPAPPVSAPPLPGAQRPSGPKPVVARPLMGGSPFPAQRPSGLKTPVGAAAASPNGPTDPTKKP